MLIRYRSSISTEDASMLKDSFFFCFVSLLLLFEIGFHISWAGLELPMDWKVILNFWLTVLNTITLSSRGTGGWTLGFILLDKHSTNWAPSSALTPYMGGREGEREAGIRGRCMGLNVGTEIRRNWGSHKAPWRAGAWKKGTPTHIHWTLFLDFFLMRWMPSSTLVMS